MRSIFDMSVQELVSMDIEDVKNIFLEEVKSLEYLDINLRNERLQYIFDRLFLLQSQEDNECVSFLKSEHRLYVDLISTYGLSEISYVRDFLNDYKSDEHNLQKKHILLKIFDFYNNHTKEESDKFNYVFRSSKVIQHSLIRMNLSFEHYFNSRVFSMFDKETLAQLYRNSFYYPTNRYSLDVLLNEENHKALYLISLIAKKVKDETGRNAEFLDRAFSILDIYCGEDSNFISFMNEVYNYFVKDEEKFKNEFLSGKRFWEIDEIMKIILDKYPYSFTNLNDFRDYLYRTKDMLHYCVFNSGELDYIYMGLFDVNRSFKDINDDNNLKYFKDAVFHSLYGISFDKAKDFVEKYGLCMNDLENDLLDSDKDIFSILKAIKNIVNLNVEDFDKIRMLQMMYYDNFIKNGEFFSGRYSSFQLESLFNRMIINTYNKKLLDVSNLEIIGEDNGVKLYDAGVTFNGILTSLDGVGNFFDEKVNMKSKWNSALFIMNHGLSCSHINNENMGVINLSSVLIGFNYIPQYSMNKMGPSDIFSETNNYDLRNEEASELGDIWKFYSASVLPNENRYGYDEILIDRYLIEDKENNLKLQPDYVIFYKFDDNYKESDGYNESLKVAKDFDIPIIVVDVQKVKEHEKKEILLMEEKLFSSSQCDGNLVNDIVSRYMNNYTGSLCMVKNDSINYSEDFSVLGMEEFFDKIVSKIESMSDKEEKDKWIQALEDVYLNETRKYKDAKRIANYRHSVSHFVLKRYNLLEKIKCLRAGISCCDLVNNRKISVIKINEEGDVWSISSLDLDNYDEANSIIKLGDCADDEFCFLFLPVNQYSAEFKTIVNFINSLNVDDCGFENFGSRFIDDDLKKIGDREGYLIESYSTLDRENRLIENLLVSYFFESGSMIVDDMICHDFDCDISFKCSEEFDFIKEVKTSALYQKIFDNDNLFHIPLNYEKMDMALNIVEEMEGYTFLNIFAPVIDKYSSSTGKRFEDVACRLLDKKANMRKEFEKLQSKFNNENKDSMINKK